MPFLIYSLLRLALLVAAGAGLYLLGMRGWLLPVLAIVIAAMLSFLLLRSHAGATAQYFAQRREEKRRTVDRVDRLISTDAAAEDAAVDAAADDEAADNPAASKSEQHPRAEQ